MNVLLYTGRLLIGQPAVVAVSAARSQTSLHQRAIAFIRTACKLGRWDEPGVNLSKGNCMAKAKLNKSWKVTEPCLSELETPCPYDKNWSTQHV